VRMSSWASRAEDSSYARPSPRTRRDSTTRMIQPKTPTMTQTAQPGISRIPVELRSCHRRLDGSRSSTTHLKLWLNNAQGARGGAEPVSMRLGGFEPPTVGLEVLSRRSARFSVVQFVTAKTASEQVLTLLCH